MESGTEGKRTGIGDLMATPEDVVNYVTEYRLCYSINDCGMCTHVYIVRA